MKKKPFIFVGVYHYLKKNLYKNIKKCFMILF